MHLQQIWKKVVGLCELKLTKLSFSLTLIRPNSYFSGPNVGEADNLFQGGGYKKGPIPQSSFLFFQNRGKIKILVLQGGLAPLLSLK